MVHHDNDPARADHPAQRRDVPTGEGTTRRGVLRGVAGFGAAGLTAGLLADAGFTATAARNRAAASRADDAHKAAPAHAEPVVARVQDVRTGEVDLFTGTRHVRVVDRGLAARLARAVVD